jgi:hypothetical protein
VDMFFADHEGTPLPLFPRERLVADNVTTFDLAQAAARFNKTPQSLASLYRQTWKDLLVTEDAAADAPTAAGTDAGGDSAVTGAVRLDPGAVASARQQLRAAALADLRREKYAQISEEHWQQFLRRCELLQMDPLQRQIYPETVHDERLGRPTLVLIMGIAGLRLQAARTLEYAGADPDRFEYGDGPNPYSATSTVYRLVGGVPRPFSSTAYWAEYCPKEPDEMWTTMQCVCLGRCSEAAALRRGFPAECSGIYTPEEMAQARGRGAASTTGCRRGTGRSTKRMRRRRV